MKFKAGDLVLRIGLTAHGELYGRHAGKWTAGRVYKIERWDFVFDDFRDSFTGPNGEGYNEFVSFDALYAEALREDSLRRAKTKHKKRFKAGDVVVYTNPQPGIEREGDFQIGDIFTVQGLGDQVPYILRAKKSPVSFVQCACVVSFGPQRSVLPSLQSSLMKRTWNLHDEYVDSFELYVEPSSVQAIVAGQSRDQRALERIRAALESAIDGCAKLGGPTGQAQREVLLKFADEAGFAVGPCKVKAGPWA